MKDSWIHRVNSGFGCAVLLALLLAALCMPARALPADELRSVQQKLIEGGFLEGAADGIDGPKTRKAMERLAAYAAQAGSAREGDELARALVAGEVPLVGAPVGPGDNGEMVERVQRRLRALSFSADQADGQYGAGTARAVMLFQRATGLSLSGVADADTQRRLFAPEAPAAAWPALIKGMKGERVLALQQRLAQLGFTIALPDGQYGAGTVLGVKAFQTYVQTAGRHQSLERALREGELNGMADPLVQELLFADGFELAPVAFKQGDGGQQVYRLQRRLIALCYLTGRPDGGYGAGTAKAVAAFQKRNGLKATGEADLETLEALYGADALEPVKPYKLVIDLGERTLKVYALGKKGRYGVLKRTMRCAIGPLAAAGEYAALTGPADEPRMKLGEGRWVRYPFVLDGALMIHSIPYDAENGAPSAGYEGTPDGTADWGGILLSEEDARLIYETCPRRTPVEVIG